MKLDGSMREEILSTIVYLGSDGALITSIEPKVSCERHTLSKYLGIMELEGLVYHKAIGKAKLWFIHKAPLRTIIALPATRRTFREQTLLHILEHLPDGVVITDEAGKVLFINKEIVSRYGGKLGSQLFDILCGNKRAQQFKKLLRVLCDGNGKTSIELIYRQKRYIRITTSSLIPNDGSTAFAFIVTDLSAHKKTESELATQKQLLEAERKALNKAAIVAETDLYGNITYANDKFVALSGFSRDEILGNTHKIVNSGYHPDSFFKTLWQTISRGGVWHGTVKNKAKDGSPYWLESAVAPVMGKNGKPVKYIAVRFDVTNYMKNKR